MEDSNLKNILMDLKEELEATIDSDCLSNIRIVERGRLVRCALSIKCLESYEDRRVWESEVISVTLEFIVNAKCSEIKMIIPRAPSFYSTYWFKGRKIELEQEVKIKIDKNIKIVGNFEFDISFFNVYNIDHKFFVKQCIISN